MRKSVSCRTKGEGKPNDLVDRIRATACFQPIHELLDSTLDTSLYVDRSVAITERFCNEVVPYKLEWCREYLDKAPDSSAFHLRGASRGLK